MMEIPLPRKIGEFINTNIMGCRFVGLSSDGEVFVEYDHDDLDLEMAAAQRVKEAFPQVTKLVTVIKPSIQEVQAMVDALNGALEPKPKPKSPLLGIEGF